MHELANVPGVIKIADFGLDRSLDTISFHQTCSTNSFGQYFYCAPQSSFFVLRMAISAVVCISSFILEFFSIYEQAFLFHLFKVKWW